MVSSGIKRCPADGCRQWATVSHMTRGGTALWRCPAGHAFQDPRDPLVQPRARNDDPDTSHDAAASMTRGAQRQRDKILGLLRDRGHLTADELDVSLFDGHHTAGRRLSELRELGLAERTDRKRDTRSGRKAYLWRLVENEPSLF